MRGERHEDSIEASVRYLLRATASTIGREFLECLSRATADILDSDYAFVGRVIDGSRVRAIAAVGDGGLLEPFEYDLEGTPCARVVAYEACQYPQHVQERFPNDELLKTMGIHAYAGVPIAAEGEVLGLLVAMSREPRESFRHYRSVLGLFADRAGAEIRRMDADAARRAADERYRQIITSCTDGVWTIDPEGKTTYVNQQMADMLGVTVDDMLDGTVFLFMDDEARHECEINMERRRSGIAERHPFRLKHADGSDVWTEMATSPLSDDAGNYVGALAMVTNVTERQRLLEKMQQKQKLESLGVLASGVAHDFNNLLVGILGSAELLQSQLGGDERSEPLIEQIRTSARSAADLTNQLLAYAGRSRFSPHTFSVNQLLDEIRSLVGTAIGQKIRVAVDYYDDLPEVHGDRGQLTQVFMNLVTNARDAIGDLGGTIHLTTGITESGTGLIENNYLPEPLPPGKYVYVQVEDTGEGMTSETLQRIFDPFFTTKAAGHGLGLAAVLGILRRHHGGIVIESQPGRGSTFTVLLPPAASQPSRREEASPGPRANRGQGRVLIVDDELMVRKIASAMLGQAGFDTEEAATGPEALERLDQAPDAYVLVLLDLTMPGQSGVEVVQELRKRGSLVPVILTSGLRDEGTATDGVDGFLPKPFRMSELLEVVHGVLGKRGE